MDTPLRLAEIVATLALAQDNAFGQPLESQLRSCLLASWMCDEAGFERDLNETGSFRNHRATFGSQREWQKGRSEAGVRVAGAR